MVINLMQVLQNRNISRYKLSKDTGISQNTLADWVKGVQNPSADKLSIVADYLGVTVNYLLGKEEKPDSEEYRLSDTDIKLIDTFRQLNPDQKKLLLDIASSWQSQ